MRSARSLAPTFTVLILLCLWVPSVQGQIPWTSLDTAGVSIVVPDRVMFADPDRRFNQSQPFVSSFDDGTLILAANLNTPGGFLTSLERVVVAYFTVEGSVVETDGFFMDSGEAWTSQNDQISPSSGSPSVAADKREGSTHYLLMNETTPWWPNLFPEFGSRFRYYGLVTTVQILERTPGGAVPLSKLADPIYGQVTSGSQVVVEGVKCFGGARALSNGDFVVGVEDRTGETVTGNRVALVAIVDGQQGSPTFGQSVVGPFVPNQGIAQETSPRLYRNLAAFDGGFAVRAYTGTEDASGHPTIGFWDNGGNPQGTWPMIIRTDSGSPLPPEGGKTTSISVLSGVETRMNSDIHSDFIYLAGRGVDASGDPDGGVYVTKINAKTRTTADEVYVTEGLSVAPQRVTVCSDKDDNVFVCWSDTSNTGNLQIAGRLYDSNLDALTDAFLVFEHSELGPNPTSGFSVKHPSCAMVDGRVLVAGVVHEDFPSLGFQATDPLAVVLSVAEILPPTPTPTETPEPVPTMNPRSDIDENGVVDANDLLILMLDWMKATGP